jgi:hypothetical protein
MDTFQDTGGAFMLQHIVTLTFVDTYLLGSFTVVRDENIKVLTKHGVEMDITTTLFTLIMGYSSLTGFTALCCLACHRYWAFKSCCLWNGIMCEFQRIIDET